MKIKLYSRFSLKELNKETMALPQDLYMSDSGCLF